MLPFFFTDSLFMLIALWALYALGYFGIIRKMGVEQGFAFVPVAAEWRISKILFSSMRSFYQAALSAVVFLAAVFLAVLPGTGLRAFPSAKGVHNFIQGGAFAVNAFFFQSQSGFGGFGFAALELLGDAANFLHKAGVNLKAALRHGLQYFGAYAVGAQA